MNDTSALDITKMAAVFGALSDPNRLLLLQQLQQGHLCACELMERTGLSQSKLSYHMRKMVEVGLVQVREDGKWAYYSVNTTVRDQAIIQLLNLTMPAPVASSAGCSCPPGECNCGKIASEIAGKPVASACCAGKKAP